MDFTRFQFQTISPHLVKHSPLKDAPEMLMILVDRPILKRLVVDPVDDWHCHRGVVPAQEYLLFKDDPVLHL